MSRDVKVQEIPRLSRSAKDALGMLVSLAHRGSRRAAAELHDTIVFANRFLTWLCEAEPQLFTAIAEHCSSWPLIYDLHREGRKQVDLLIKSLRLGAKTQINLASGKTFSWQKPANIVALSLFRTAHAARRAPISKWGRHEWALMSRQYPNRTAADMKLKEIEKWGRQGAGKRLPPLSKNSAAQWARQTVELFHLVYGHDFERHCDLQELKKSVSHRARDNYRRVGGRGVIRNEMLKAVKQAWHSIAALE